MGTASALAGTANDHRLLYIVKEGRHGLMRIYKRYVIMCGRDYFLPTFVHRQALQRHGPTVIRSLMITCFSCIMGRSGDTYK